MMISILHTAGVTEPLRGAPDPPPPGPARPPPRASGGLPGLGHLLALRRAPLELFARVHRECGEIGEMRWASRPVVLLVGAEAQEAFFRAPDEVLDQAAAYPFMTPIFGRGVVFDAGPEQRRQAIRNRALRDELMRGHAEAIAEETQRAAAALGESGEIDLLDFFAELTLYTSSTCLLGREFRAELGPEFAACYHDLEKGTDAFAYVNPYLPLPSFRKRDRARRRLVELMTEILERREREGRVTSDLLSVLVRLREPDGRPRYSADQLTGMFIAMMFAGHHTTSGTAAWTLIELLRHSGPLGRVVAELDALYADGRAVSYQALREIPELECALKEALRLHPPLIILMRRVRRDFHYKGWRVEAGKTLAVSPALSNRLPEHFPDPERFDPDRYRPPREEDRQGFAWIPFGAGRHRCVGAAFAMMQLKAILSVLLRGFELELAQPPASYRNDHSKMVVQLRQPCRVRYRRRRPPATATRAPAGAAPAAAASRRVARLRLDLDLCQGHAVCAGEAPELFALDPATLKARIRLERPGPELRARAEAAARHCPTGALSLVDD
jgi:sterol 14-demethylase